MSPVARSDRHAGVAVLVAGVGVAVAVGMAWLLAVLTSRGDVELRLGDDLFEVGRVENLARQVAEDGPVPFADLTNRDRPIHIQHLGDDPGQGWYAFGAVDPNDPTCIVSWRAGAAHFVNECTDETYPPDGTGLRRYETIVEDDRLLVDLNSPEDRSGDGDQEPDQEPDREPDDPGPDG